MNELRLTALLTKHVLEIKSRGWADGAESSRRIYSGDYAPVPNEIHAAASKETIDLIWALKDKIMELANETAD